MFRCLIFMLFMSVSALGQQVLEGIIIDKETGKPVPFASIGVFGTSQGTSSNSNGEFSISVNLPVTLKITCIGYASLILENLTEVDRIELRPATIQLKEIVVLNKKVNARKVMRKAFARVNKNYLGDGFLQKFFYRHYCKDNDNYGRLIEAYVDVWKDNGYKVSRKAAGEKEEIRITQLRRSLDKTTNTQGHEPISVGNILQADLVGYQMQEPSNHMSFYTEVSNLKTDFDSYTFTFEGITYFDGEEVYHIGYAYKRDSVLTTTGNYYQLTQSTGSLFISTDNFAIIKSEDVKSYDNNTIRTVAYYHKIGDQYYTYHLVRDGKTRTFDSLSHDFHIELMSVDITDEEDKRFVGKLPGREGLLDIPYNPNFWASHTTLKTTPLEDEIIQDLGGGASLNEQFERYQQYELNTHNGGVDAEEKFKWLMENGKGEDIFYLLFWSDDFLPYLQELELAKRLNKRYWNKITFVFISLSDDEELWKKTVKQYNFSADGLINYRFGKHSKIAKSFDITAVPGYVLIGPDGKVFDAEAKRPSNKLLDEDFKTLLEL